MSSEKTPSWHGPWALAAAAVAIVTILAGASLYLVHSVRSLPGDVVEGGRAALRDLQEVARAFRTGNVTTSFRSYATEVSGSSYLQFARLKEMEVFERRDEARVLWGQLALPDVVVEARAPVEYTYYLDLDKAWRFGLEGREVIVLAPAIEFNTPAIDVSALRFEVREGSVFRDEAAVTARLQQGLTVLAVQRARQNVALVRETGRRRVEAFVETWLARSFGDGGAYRARVFFPGEAPTLPEKTPALNPLGD